MNIHALRQQKCDLRNEAMTILARTGKRRPTENERSRLTEIENQMRTINLELSEVEGLHSSETAPGAVLAAWQGGPQTASARGEKSVNKVYAKLSDQLVASGLQPTQKADSMAPFASLADQLRCVRNAAISGVDPRLLEVNAALGGNESVPSEGGFLVLPSYAADLILKVYQQAELAQRCFRMPMQSSRLIMHAVDEDSRKDGARWGGILSYWLAEAATYQPTKPKFREMQFVANKLIALVYGTEEQLSDGPAFEAYLRETCPQEIAFQIDQAIFNGPGAGAPLGFMNSGALYVTPKDSGQTAGTITTSNILNMWSHMWAKSRQNAVWFVNQDIEPSLIPLTLGSPSLAQVLLYNAPGIAGNNGQYGKMFGRDVIPVEQALPLGTQGDIVLVDLSQYVLAERMPAVRVDTSIHVSFLTGETAFRFMLRLDGQPTWKKPLTPYQGSALKSPFVALATRS